MIPGIPGEAIREAVNAWIRDHLHPNDAGYQAMADAINLDMLLPPPR